MNVVMVDLDYNFAERDDIRVNLLPAETEALFVLHVNRGEVVSRGKLAAGLWGMTKLYPEKWDECIKAYIYRLRKKIEPIGGTIDNVWGEGYVLTWEEWSEPGEIDAKWRRWPKERIAIVADMRAKNLSYGQIADRLGVTQSAVAGIVDRHLNDRGAA